MAELDNENIGVVRVFDNITIETIHDRYNIQLMSSADVGVCGITFDNAHACNWMHDDTIIREFPLAHQENIICETFGDRHGTLYGGILTRRFFGYDTRNGGAWCDGWAGITNAERIVLLRTQISTLVDTFQRFE